LFLLLHLSFISSFASSLSLDLALVEAYATCIILASLCVDFACLKAETTLITIASLIAQYKLEGGL
jgi:hypothetical protein